ncbi:MAG: hypothetical protein D6B25_06635 [Desulfobulbaceae bacterium]|nr:MAG: hypothetical protein D6B25_06635 [Desulfobulbaceae bacterium]
MLEPAVTPSRVCWNGLSFHLDPGCEVTIKNDSHLIIEHQLSPLAEIRWSITGKKKRNKNFQSLDRDLSAKYERLKISDISRFQTISSNFELASYRTNHGEHRELVLALQCKSCGTNYLLHCADSQEQSKPIVTLYEQLSCTHPGTVRNQVWQIQDFYFLVPQTFSLSSQRFSPGNSILTFTNGPTILYYGRIVPTLAGSHQEDYATLFCSLTGLRQDQLVEEKSTFSGLNTPSLTSRIATLLHRRKIFQWGHAQIFEDHDRFLVVSLQSRKRIDTDLQNRLSNGYGLI